MNKTLNVLITDNNEIITNIISGYLTNDKRFNILTPEDNEDNEIELINKLKPDIVITNLKKKNGWTGMNIIRYFKNNNFCPKFFIISGSIYEYKDEISELNIRYYLQKPFISSEMVQILNKIYEDNK